MSDYLRKKLKVIYMDPNDIKPYHRNARTHGSELTFLCKAIEEDGFDASHAIGVDKDGVIIYGHGRRLAAIQLGMKEVPVVVRTDMTPEQVKRARLTDNKLSDMSGWDFEALDAELAELKDLDIDMTEFGFEDLSQYDTAEGAMIETEDTEADDAPQSDDDLPQTFRLMITSDDIDELYDIKDELTARGISCQILE